MEVISPRPSDPFAWHAYFVSPAIARGPEPPYPAFHQVDRLGPDVDQHRLPTIGPQSGGHRAGRAADGSVQDARELGRPGAGGAGATRARSTTCACATRAAAGTRRRPATSISPAPHRAAARPMMPGPIAGGVCGAQLEHRLSPLPPLATAASLTLNKLDQSCPGLDASIGERCTEPRHPRQPRRSTGACTSTAATTATCWTSSAVRGDGAPVDARRDARGRPVQGLGQQRHRGGALGPRRRQPLPASCADTTTPTIRSPATVHLRAQDLALEGRPRHPEDRSRA